MKRRDFLKTTGFGVTSIAILGKMNASHLFAGTGIDYLEDNHRPIDVKTNIKPICANRIHKSAYEGPCRFGNLISLTTEAERNNANINCDLFVESIQKKLTKEGVMLKPVSVEYPEGDIITQKDWRKLDADVSDVDLFLITYRVPGIERYKKPVAMMSSGITNVDIAASFRNKGLEGYAPYDWDELNRLIALLQVRKAVEQTKLLSITDRPDFSPYGVYSACNLEDMKNELGVDYHVVSYKEFFSEIDRIAQSKYEKKKIEEITDNLINNAQKVHMQREYIISDVTFYFATRSLMKRYGCNAFSIRCFELCGSKRPAKAKFVPCLTHSLLKDRGYPSACEGDINVLLAMMLEMYISKKSSYIGNPYFNKEKDTVNLYHDVPGLKMKGFNEPDLPYEIRNFTFGGWGSTVRYDFSLDKGQEVTLGRFDPTATKLLITKGTITEGFGVNVVGCSLGLIIKIPNAIEFFHKQAETGHHLAMVYGDIKQELKELADIMDFQILEVT